MRITTDQELEGMSKAASVIALILSKMIAYTEVGKTTKEIDQFGQSLFDEYKAVSAPISLYKFPSCTAISINEVMAHGIASDYTLQEGDLINIDVSGSVGEFFADNGSSFIVGEDKRKLQPLIDASKDILLRAIDKMTDGVDFNTVGYFVDKSAIMKGFKTIKDLAGHGVGRSLHEPPVNIIGFSHPQVNEVFTKGDVLAVEYFISNGPEMSKTDEDGWSLIGNKEGFVAQQEHTILITEGKPVILTLENGI